MWRHTSPTRAIGRPSVEEAGPSRRWNHANKSTIVIVYETAFESQKLFVPQLTVAKYILSESLIQIFLFFMFNHGQYNARVEVVIKCPTAKIRADVVKNAAELTTMSIGLYYNNRQLNFRLSAQIAKLWLFVKGMSK